MVSKHACNVYFTVEHEAILLANGSLVEHGVYGLLALLYRPEAFFRGNDSVALATQLSLVNLVEPLLVLNAILIHQAPSGTIEEFFSFCLLLPTFEGVALEQYNHDPHLKLPDPVLVNVVLVCSKP